MHLLPPMRLALTGCLIEWRELQNYTHDTVVQKTGSRNKMIKAAVMRNLPKHITNDLAIQFRDAKTTTEVRHTIYIYMHDYQIGMPRGQTGPMPCMTANETEENNADTDPNTQDKNTEQDPDKSANNDEELYATTKGKGKGKKGFQRVWGVLALWRVGASTPGNVHI